MPRGAYPDFYPELPGSVTVLKDGLKNQRTRTLSGKKIVLLGTASDGPVLENVTIRSYDDGERLFGKYYDSDTGVKKSANLVRGLKRLYDAGADNIDLMRISGQIAKAKIKLEGVIKEVSHQHREYATVEGNERTAIDMELPATPVELNINGVQYDYAIMDNVKVYGDGKLLSTSAFVVDNENGEVVIKENVTNSSADIDIEYDLIYVDVRDIPAIIEVKATNQALTATDQTDVTFQVPEIDAETPLVEDPEDPIVDNPTTDYGDTIQVLEDGVNITDDISSIDYETGIVNFGQAHSGTVTASYVYQTTDVWEVPEKSADNEYRLANDNIVPDSETIRVSIIGGSTTDLSKNEYSIDYRAGLITIYNMDNYSGVDGVSYKYKVTSKDTKIKNDRASGTIQKIYLNYTADPNKPVAITAAGKELGEDAFSVNYNEMNTTVIYLNPGFANVKDDLYIKYFWTEEKLIEPEIDGESIFGGNKYNDIEMHIKDHIVEKTDRYYVPKTGDLVNAAPNLYTFPDSDTNILPDSVYIEDADGTVLVADDGDYTLYPETGQVEVDSTGNFVEPLSVNYAVIKEELKKTTVVRGKFDPTTNDAGEDGGGHYNDIILELSPDRRIAKFMNGDIVKDYFVTNPANIMLVDEMANTETNLADTDKSYTIDYGNGLVKFDNALQLYEKVKVVEYEYYNVASKQATIFKPKDKYIDGKENPIVIDNIGPEIVTIGQFINTVNNHARNNNVLRLSIDNQFVANSALDLKTPEKKLLDDGSVNYTRVRFTGGKDEADLTKEEIYEKLGGKRDADGELIEPGAYDVLMDVEDADIVLPLGVFADDKLLSNYKSFAQQLANFCAMCFLQNNEIRGVIGTQPLTTPTRLNLIEKIRKLEQLETDFWMMDDKFDFERDREGNRVDIGKYLTVVGYDKIYDDNNLAVPSIESGACDFAAIASMVAPYNSPTNEPTNSGRLAYNMSTNQAARLARNKIVPAKVKNGTPKILDAMTCAQPTSGWTRYFTVDIVFDTIDLLRQVFDKYIGQGNTLEKRASLNADIRDALKKQPTLVNYDFNMLMDPNDNTMSRIIIELDLVPAGELQKIKTVVSINAQMQ